MKPKVLILSGLYDFSTDLVALNLREKNIPFVRLNKEHFGDYRFSLDPLCPSLRITGLGIDTEVSSNLASVWFRQPVFLRNTPSAPLTPQEQLIRSQWNAFLRALSVFDKAYWMNYPQSTYLAECKPFQLLMAKRYGFQVPKTIVGNDADAIKKTFKKEMVVKSLDTVLLREKDDCLFTYTTVTNPELLDDNQVSQVPLLAQELLENKRDVRVTIVGEKVFAVRILHKGCGISGDWRLLPKEDLEYEDFRLSPEIERSCIELSENLGLTFAAIDLIEIRDGTFFIEVNPTGEWGWISNEERTIDKTIADWLAGPKRRL